MSLTIPTGKVRRKRRSHYVQLLAKYGGIGYDGEHNTAIDFLMIMCLAEYVSTSYSGAIESELKALRGKSPCQR